MNLTSHLLWGAAIGSKISNPLLALPLALLSHYFLDSLPHSDYSIENIKHKKWNKAFFDCLKIFMDISLGILLIFLFSEDKPIILAGAFLAIMPDGITLLSRIFPENKLTIMHQKLHMDVNIVGDRKENKKIPLWKATLSQAAAIVTAILILR